jgi:two-component system CheB/CheR fusion protein
MFGTDLSRDPLEFAKKGVYPASLVSDVPQEYLDKYFILEDGNFRIKPFIRNKIIFAEHNIIKDFPFHKMDVISCRNLIIYFNVKLQEEIISIFNNAINLEGLLILGSSETISEKTALFSALDPGLRIYKNLKKGKPIYLLNKLSYRNHDLRPKIIKETTPNEEFKKQITELFIAELNVVSLLIDYNFQILSSMGRAKDILIFPDEGFTSHLNQMLPKNISLLISSSIRSLSQSNPLLKYHNIIYQGNNISYYDILLQYVPNIFELDIKTYMVIFIPSRKIYKTSESSEQKKLEEVPISKLEELENELSLTRKNLEYFVKDLELNNEELQTANEELLATNEELKSSNEELQSVNEELHTMNSEFQQKLIEIESMNSDMDNLLRSTDIGTIFLDKDMLIRKFTPAAREQFNLTLNDLGRPLSHFTSNFVIPNYHKTLEKLLGQVVLNATSNQKEIMTSNGKTYLQRINPFINGNNEVLGAVISYVDISPMKRLEAHLEDTAKKLDIVLKYAKSNITMLELDGRVLYANRVLLDVDKEEYIGSSIYDFTSKEISNTLKKKIEAVKESKEHVEFQYILTTPSGKELHYFNTMSPIIIDEKVTGVIILSMDVSEIKSIQISLEHNNKELERKNKELEEFAYIASHDLREPIRTILGFAGIIQRELKNNKNEKINQGLIYISDSVKRMQGLVDGLLEYSRIGQEDRDKEIDLNEIVTFILEDLQQATKDTKMIIEVDTLPTISGYPLALRMIFQNLITNATKFSQRDITPIIKIGVEEQKDFWLFHVTDNGIGIAEKFYKKIFLIFQRLNASEYEKGSGIGLSLCKKYVELHKGEIWVKSKINVGTTFYFTLEK